MSKNNEIGPCRTMKSEEPVELRIPVPWGYVSAKAWGNPESKTPILGVHGWLDNAGTFDRLIPNLSNSLYFVAVDLPGHGLSSHLPPGIPYHFTDFVTTMRRITNYFKWSKFSIVGHSMGAGLAVYFASMFPNAVDRVVMLDMIKPISNDEGPTGESLSNSIDAFLALEEKIKPELQASYSFEDAVNRLRAATQNSLTEDSAKRLLTRGSLRVDEDKWTFRRDLRMRSPSMYRFSHEGSLNILQNIKCHNLLIKAIDAPTWLPKEVVDKTLALYREKCATFQYVEVDGNHFVHLNEPEKIHDIVNEFLLGLPPTLKSGL